MNVTMTPRINRVSAYLAAFNRANGDISTETFDKVYAHLLSELKKSQAQEDLASQQSMCEV